MKYKFLTLIGISCLISTTVVLAADDCQDLSNQVKQWENEAHLNDRKGEENGRMGDRASGTMQQYYYNMSIGNYKRVSYLLGKVQDAKILIDQGDCSEFAQRQQQSQKEIFIKNCINHIFVPNNSMHNFYLNKAQMTCDLKWHQRKRDK